MNTPLVIAHAIPWIFWGALMGLLATAGRSWVNLLLLPAGSSVVLLIAARFASAGAVLVASAALHLLLLVFSVGSYLAFVRRERRSGKPW